MNREQAIAHLDEQGYVILEGALTPDQANQLRDRSAELIAQERTELITQERAASDEYIYMDGKSQRVWNLVNKGRIYEEMIQHPRVLELQEYLLGDDCILSSFTVNLIGPGSAAGRWHNDSPPLGTFPDPLPSNALCANTIYVLDDFTQENGATWMVPDSHKRSHRPEPQGQYDDGIQLAAHKGDIVVFNGGTWHASGANHTANERMILLGFFCRSFAKPQQDGFRLAEPELVERATPTLKRLLGFESQSGLRT